MASREWYYLRKVGAFLGINKESELLADMLCF